MRETALQCVNGPEVLPEGCHDWVETDSENAPLHQHHVIGPMHIWQSTKTVHKHGESERKQKVAGSQNRRPNDELRIALAAQKGGQLENAPPD